MKKNRIWLSSMSTQLQGAKIMSELEWRRVNHAPKSDLNEEA
jgi:hypothetical protein